jgi:superfamily I DNA/RNA helicase
LPKAFEPRLVENLSLGQIAEEDQLRLLLLDDWQSQCIDDFLFENQRALVSGPPGTGKTLVAAEAARRLGKQGKQVLLVCFTEALAHWLRREIAGSTVEVWAIKRLAIDLRRRAGTKVDVPERRQDWTPEFWRAQVPAALREAGAIVDALDYYAVIVDEGQDLDHDDWELIGRLSSKDCRLWVFSDPSQTLWPDREMPAASFAKYQLRIQYRCDPEIQTLASLYQSDTKRRDRQPEPSATSQAPADKRMAVVRCSARDSVPRTVARQIDKLMSEGLCPSDIAIVSLVSRTDRGALAGLDSLEGHRLVRADDPRIRNEIVADSVYRFKGLERPAVILTDLSLRGLESDAIRRAKMNVAITRAQSFLRIVDTSEAIAQERELGVVVG